PLPGNHLQRLGHVLAELVQAAAAARAGRWARIDNPLAWQMRRQRATGRFAPLKALHLNLRTLGSELRYRLGLGRILLELGQLELELLEHRAAFRRLAVLLVLELGDLVLQLLDLERARLRDALGCGGLRLGDDQGLALRQNERVRGGKIGRER